MNEPQQQRRLGPYNLTRKLGEGGMGAVFLGRHEVLDVDHAIKILPPKLAQNAQFIERFLREARHAARLHHPHIVQVVGADKYGEVRYIAMQFVPGESLEKMVRGKGPLSPHRAVRYCFHVAAALAYAHNHGMIHRDVKPDNVLVDESDNARLTDFGLVRDVNASPEGAGLTQSGAVLGTPFYMSPEQWKGEGVDHRSDIYAIGVMLFYLLSRKYPYPGEGPAQILRRQIDGNVDPLRSHCPGVDDDLCSLVHRIVDVNPEKRPQNAVEVLDLLKQWWESHPNDEGLSLDTNVGGTVVRTTTTAPTTAEIPSSIGDDEPQLTPPTNDATLMESQGTVASNRPAGGPGTPPPSGAGGLQFDGPAPPPPPPGATGTPLPGGMHASGSGTPPQVVMTEHGPVLMTQSGMGQSVITLAQHPSHARQMKIWMTLVAVLVIVVAVVVVVLVSRGNGPAPQVPGAELALDIPADTATETSPLFVNQPKYSIPGTARGDVTLDGEPYEFGTAVPLDSGLNKLRLQVTGENGKTVSRTLFIHLDTTVPVLQLPGFTARDGEFRARSADPMIVRGSVSDDDPQVQVILKRSSDADWQPLQLTNGRFRFPLEVSPEPVSMWLQAVDRAGNETTAITVTVEFEPPTITSISVDDTPTIEVKDPREPITIRGTLNTGAGVTLLVNGQDIGATVEADGTFRFPFTPGMAGEVELTLQPINRDGRKGKVETRTLDIRRRIYEEVEEPEGRYPEYRRLTDGMTCVLIPAGTYKRGAPPHLEIGNAPTGTVSLTAYLIDKTEVSNAQYVMFLNEAGKMMQPLTPDEVWGDYIDKDHCRLSWDATAEAWRAEDGYGNRPVVGVTWRGAQLYARWADPYGGSLPSEAQWEVAARGRDGLHFPWGNDLPTQIHAHYLDSGYGDEPLDVTDAKLASGRSPFGLWMMSGNVEEWCLDYYKVTAYIELAGRTDPAVTTAPAGSTARTVRGGSFRTTAERLPEDLPNVDSSESDLCPFFRTRAQPDEGQPWRGFRCAATAPDKRDR